MGNAIVGDWLGMLCSHAVHLQTELVTRLGEGLTGLPLRRTPVVFCCSASEKWGAFMEWGVTKDAVHVCPLESFESSWRGTKLEKQEENSISQVGRNSASFFDADLPFKEYTRHFTSPGSGYWRQTAWICASALTFKVTQEARLNFLIWLDFSFLICKTKLGVVTVGCCWR